MILTVVLTLVIAGCSTGGGGKFTEAQEETYLNEYYTMATKPSLPKVVMADLDKNIERMSLEGASNAVDALIFAMYEEAPNMSEKMNGLQESMIKYAKDGVDFNDSASYSKIEDATLKAFLGEAENQNFKIIEESGGYTIVPDMDVLLTKYTSYMSDALKTMVEFSKVEYEKPFFNVEEQKFDLDLVVERILMMEEGAKKYPDSGYVKAFNESKAYYYEIYFGANSEYLVDTSKKVLPDVLEHYKKTIEAHKDTQLATDLTAFLNKLKETDNKITDDVIVFVSGLTKYEAEVSSEETSGVSDAVQDAIKQNEK